MDELIHLNDAVIELEVDRSTLYRWSKDGKLPIYKKSGKSYVKKEDLEQVKKEFTELKPIHGREK